VAPAVCRVAETHPHKVVILSRDVAGIPRPPSREAVWIRRDPEPEAVAGPEVAEDEPESMPIAALPAPWHGQETRRMRVSARDLSPEQRMAARKARGCGCGGKK
jgi:hypothetical protein